MIRWMPVLMGLALLIGCGPKVEIRTDPVAVTGKLTVAGAPVGPVTLTFQPLDAGQFVPMKIEADGAISGKLIPGKYAYFVTAREEDPAAIEKVAAKFREADLNRTVTISADKSTIDIALD